MSNKDLEDLIEMAKNEPIIEYLDIPYERNESVDDEEIKFKISNTLKDEIIKIVKGISNSAVDDIIEEIQIMENGRNKNV